jgi:hypothetical protein
MSMIVGGHCPDSLRVACMPSYATGFRTLVLLTCLATVDLCYFQAEIDNLLLIENLGSGNSATAVVRPNVQIDHGRRNG